MSEGPKSRILLNNPSSQKVIGLKKISEPNFAIKIKGTNKGESFNEL
jgi:hypothetical protein